MQAAAGFVVVMSNPRGSSGRHTAWGQAINGPKHHEGRPAPGGAASTSMTCWPCSTTRWRRTRSATPIASACSAGATAATWRRCWPGATATASGRSAASGPCNNMITEEFSSDISTAWRGDDRRDGRRRSRRVRQGVADPVRQGHHRADADHPLRERPPLPDQPGRGAVRGAAHAGQGRDVLPLPGREPRADPQRLTASTARCAPRSSWSSSPSASPPADRTARTARRRRAPICDSGARIDARARIRLWKSGSWTGARRARRR